MPSDDEAAIRELERLRERGAAFLVFSWSSFWWFEYYPRFFQYLQSTFSFAVQEEFVAIFDLR